MSGRKLPSIKQWVSGALAMLVLLNGAGFLVIYKSLDIYLYYQHQQAQIASVKEKEKLITLSFETRYVKQEGKNFTWVEEAEFRYQGRMYDVQHRHKGKDSITFLVERDRAEERLESLVFGNKRDNNQPLASLGWVHLIIVEGLCQGQDLEPNFKFRWQEHAPFLKVATNQFNQPHTPPPAV